MANAKEFELIECGGTPYEIGRQWGKACKENILSTTRNVIDTMVSFSNLSREQVLSMGKLKRPTSLYGPLKAMKKKCIKQSKECR